MNLDQLAEMGLSLPDSSSRVRLGDSVRSKVANLLKPKRPSLKVIGLAVIATHRMKKMSEEWAEQRKIKEALVKKMQEMMKGKKGKRVSNGR